MCGLTCYNEEIPELPWVDRGIEWKHSFCSHDYTLQWLSHFEESKGISDSYTSCVVVWLNLIQQGNLCTTVWVENTPSVAMTTLYSGYPILRKAKVYLIVIPLVLLCGLTWYNEEIPELPWVERWKYCSCRRDCNFTAVTSFCRKSKINDNYSNFIPLGYIMLMQLLLQPVEKILIHN